MAKTKLTKNQVCAAFNAVRENLKGQEFKTTEAMRILMTAKIPYVNPNGVYELIKLGILIKGKFGCCVFPCEPVYVGKFETYLNTMRSPAKQVIEDIVEVEHKAEPVEMVNVIDSSIKVLKETGDYKVFKKVVTWEEV